MSPRRSAADVGTECSECDKVELEKRLDAEESALAFQRELEKLDKEHSIALDAAAENATTDLQKARWQSEFELGKLFHEKLAELAGGSIDRSRDSAKYVQTAAAWIATLYTGLLALVFSVTDNPLPIRGAYAAVFLGLAVALSAAYLAFVTRTVKVRAAAGGSSLTEQQMKRSDLLIRWVNSTVQDRRWAIRASVISLALGVAFIPAAFVSHSRSAPVPDAPVAPAIPGEIAGEVGAAATELFRAQLDGYKAAVAARNEAIVKSSGDAASISADESTINSVALWLAGAGLLAVLLGPLIYGRLRDGPVGEAP